MIGSDNTYDVIVVGGGHAGIEAALASARIGCKTLLITSNLDTIGQMSCNPAIGGIGKGHLVREIDALGGEMGINTDHTGIQFRLLNTKKGPAVWASRAQCDKKAYQLRIKWSVERQANLFLKQGTIEDLIITNARIMGIRTKTGLEYTAKSVVLTTGTFLRGLIHIGRSKIDGGRSGEPAVGGVTSCLQKYGFEIGRLKTGTPPRVNRRSIDFSVLQPQPGDNKISHFSFRLSEKFHVEQLPCYITHTTSATQSIIKENLHLSAMYSGEIKGIGPRYCPSIEDKIVKFQEKETHQVFLEPEGRHTEEFYINGVSTSMPEEVQFRIVRSIKGLENAEITRSAYAIEYDYSKPYQLHPSLESKIIENLFFAGQINGTSGYEEAAAQGIVAGANAALKCIDREAWMPTRADSYIGVLVDDLVTLSTDEPYRMFTSRAEYRLQLRQDNADIRLTEIGRRFGLVGDPQWKIFTEKKSLIDYEMTRLQSTRYNGTSFFELLKRPDVTYASLPIANMNLPEEVREQVEIQIKYAGYIARDLEQISRFKRMEDQRIPSSIDYGLIPSLRTEARQKLIRYRPDSIGQASRISGVTPADIAILLVWVRKIKSGN